MRRILLYASLGALPCCRGWQLWVGGGGPGARAGASLSLWNGTLFLFGGRGNERMTPHDPKTYEITKINGSFQFATYDGKHVKTCDGNLTYDECYDIEVDTQFNDVWAYSLDCARSGDGGCEDSGWALVDGGAPMGGCKLVNGVYVCSHPTERVHHGAGIFGDGTLFIYGGFGQMCEDYCSDVWTLDLAACAVSAAGATSTTASCAWQKHGHGDREVPQSPALSEVLESDVGDSYTRSDDDGPLMGPGKRWRMAYAQPPQLSSSSRSGSSSSSTDTSSSSAGGGGDGLTSEETAARPPWDWVMFGGHRLWQGFARENSAENDWNSTATYPFGGYLDDLWTITWDRSGGSSSSLTSSSPSVSPSSASSGSSSSNRSTAVRGAIVWQQLLPRESCYAHVGATWESRNELACTIHWPPPRASAALTVHGGSLYLHGGFTAQYPYPQVLGRGSGAGTAALSSESRSSYPTQPYYLSDLWRYDKASGLWGQVVPLGSSGGRPSARRGHSLTSLGLGSGALMLVGGYAGNELLGETWLFNVTTSRWLQKTTHVHPLLPPNCTSDVLLEGTAAEGITEDNLLLAIPQALLNGSADASSLSAFRSGLAAGGPYVLHTPSGPVVSVGYSVAGEPTRGISTLPPLRIPQPRRRAPGWDGCRDRIDGRGDLPQTLQWAQPGQRADHAAVYSPAHKLLMLYGGEVLTSGEEARSNRVTHPTVVDGQLWGWRADYCPSKCSGRGDCVFGYCHCRQGWYGVDCSNATCPGDYCRYDPDTHKQICSHCCSSPVYVPPTGDLSADELTQYESAAAEALDVWANPWAFASDTRYPYSDSAALQKAACSDSIRGRSHGTCNGFGSCQCIPPFVGQDCATLDCPRNCSGRGVCSLDFPVGRCMCDPPFSGPDCSTVLCLNNCSYPNGQCNHTTGECTCAWLANPYNRTQLFRQFEGPDCSYVTAFAAAQRSAALSSFTIVAAALSAMAALFLAAAPPRYV